MNLEEIRALIELMVAHDLARLELREGERHILLRRAVPGAGSSAAQGPASAGQAVGVGVPSDPAGLQTGPGAPAVSVPQEREVVYIRSPMVGTFYAAPDPESPPFVSVGAMVGPDTVVCLIEAMKVFNEIKAEVQGRITQVLVKNATAVEYDQPLFAVEPA